MPPAGPDLQYDGGRRGSNDRDGVFIADFIEKIKVEPKSRFMGNGRDMESVLVEQPRAMSTAKAFLKAARVAISRGGYSS